MRIPFTPFQVLSPQPSLDQSNDNPLPPYTLIPLFLRTHPPQSHQRVLARPCCYHSVLHLRNSCSNVADLADLYNMPSAFHDIASPLGLTASAQLFGAVRNLRTMAIPYHADQVPWRWEVIASP